MASDADTFGRLDRFRTREAEQYLGGLEPDDDEEEVDLNGLRRYVMALARIFPLWQVAEYLIPALLYASVINATIIFIVFMLQNIF